MQLCKKILDDYPKACFCTNLHIKGVMNETFNFNDLDDIENVKNGEYGVVFFIDEIQNYLNSLQSKQIPLSTIVQLTQARKQRKIIIGTSQVYSRMAKPLREQIRNVVLCHKLFGFVQYNELIDSIETKEDSTGKLKPIIKDRFIFFHTPSLYNSYDTFKVSYGITKKVKNDNIVILDNNNYMEM